MTPDEIHAIAAEVVRLLKATPADQDVMLCKRDAAKYVGVSLTTFDRLRRSDNSLRPATTTPLRWSKAVLQQRAIKARRLCLAAA